MWSYVSITLTYILLTINSTIFLEYGRAGLNADDAIISNAAVVIIAVISSFSKC